MLHNYKGDIFMEENYMEKYKDIIFDISLMKDTDGSGTPWYSDEYRFQH